MWMTLWKILSWLSIWRKDRQLSKKTCTRCSIVSLSLKCDASGRHLAKYIYYVYDSLFRICAEGSGYQEPRLGQSSKTPVLDCKFRDMWQMFLLISLPGRRAWAAEACVHCTLLCSSSCQGTVPGTTRLTTRTTTWCAKSNRDTTTFLLPHVALRCGA